MSIITSQWDNALQYQLKQPYIKSIEERLKLDASKGYTIVPRINNVFNAYKKTDFDKVKVLILGQDPYYTPNSADGLAFSSSDLTPSLEVIFEEIKGSTGRIRTQTNLEDWADQGVFLLNTILTGLQGRVALRHENIGWEHLTKATITALNTRRQPMVVMLWGKHAIDFGKPLDNGYNLVLRAPHPASDKYGNNPRTFRGCQHFSYCNDWMQSKGLKQINWGDPIKSINHG